MEHPFANWLNDSQWFHSFIIQGVRQKDNNNSFWADFTLDCLYFFICTKSFCIGESFLLLSFFMLVSLVFQSHTYHCALNHWFFCNQSSESLTLMNKVRFWWRDLESMGTIYDNLMFFFVDSIDSIAYSTFLL